jgi:hypothetical protein
MTKYLFHTSELGVSDIGIHLLRSGFNYQTINWNEIEFIKIEKGRELHNWWITFLLGSVLLTIGGYLSIRTFDILMNKNHPEYYAKMLLFLLIPCIGIYFLYNSLRVGVIVRIRYNAYKKKMFPLREIVKENQLNEFKSLVTEKLGSKKVNV